MKLIDKSLSQIVITATLIYTNVSEATNSQIKHSKITTTKKIDSDCIRKVSNEDNLKISEFIKKSKDVRENKSLTQQEKNIQLNSLINEYSNSISPDGLNALAAIYSRENLDQLFELLDSDTNAKNAYKAYLNSFENLSKTRNSYSNTNSLILSITRASKLNKAGNDFSQKGNDLIKSIQVSKINEIYKKEMIKGIYQHQMSEAALNGNAGSQKAQEAERSKPYFMAALPIVVIGAAYVGLAAGATATGAGVATLAGGAAASTPSITAPSAVIAGHA